MYLRSKARSRGHQEVNTIGCNLRFSDQCRFDDIPISSRLIETYNIFIFMGNPNFWAAFKQFWGK